MYTYKFSHVSVKQEMSLKKDKRRQIKKGRKYIENTRLVLNIAQVYPARLRKSQITRLAE